MGFRLEAVQKTILLLAFAGIGIATVAAYQNPATGYELSIYTETPITFWVASCFALLASILTVFTNDNRSIRIVGAILGGLTMITVTLLPIIRGYHYVGEADSLSHLGTAIEMNAGVRAITESRYPIVHTLSTILHKVTGLPIRHTMLIVVVVFVAVFLVFVPLVVRELTGGGWTTYIGFFSGLLLLPLNHISPSLFVHPTSQAIMYAPAFLFSFFILYKQRTVRHSVIFILIATMFVLLHPQQAANFVLFFGLIAVMQIGHDCLDSYWLDRRSEWVLPEVTYFTAVFAFWALNLPVFWRNFESVYMIPFEETQAASSTVTRSVSLTEVGGSLPEVFVKLFLVSLVYIILTGLLMLLVVRRFRRPRLLTTRDKTTPDGGTKQRLPLYMFGGLVGISMIFFVYLVGGISDQYFRHLGLLMVFGTILGAIMIGRTMRYLKHRWSNTTARRSVALVLILFTALSLPVVFASPYIYHSSDHVTEAQMEGHEMTFEHRSDSMTFADVRSKVYRYAHATQGSSLPEESYYQEDRRDIPDHFADRSLRLYYSEPVYVPVTEADRTRDPVLWKGFRFSHEDFEYLDSEPGINRVQTNGGYDLYLIDPIERPEPDFGERG